MLDIPFSVRASGMLVVACLVLYPAGAHVIGVHQGPPETAQAAYARIRDEGLSRSKVMDYATELIDGVGPRLTGSRNLKKAIDWAREQLTQMGLSHVRAESWGSLGSAGSSATSGSAWWRLTPLCSSRTPLRGLRPPPAH